MSHCVAPWLTMVGGDGAWVVVVVVQVLGRCSVTSLSPGTSSWGRVISVLETTASWELPGGHQAGCGGLGCRRGGRSWRSVPRRGLKEQEVKAQFCIEGAENSED